MQSLAVNGVIRHHINEILALPVIIIRELLEIIGIFACSEVELSTIDDFVTHADAIVKFVIDSRSGIIKLWGISCVNWPVDIYLGEKSLGHPFSWFAIGILCDILCQLRYNLSQLLLQPEGNVLA